MIIHNVLRCRESKLKNVFFREPRKYLGSLTFTWEQRKLGDIADIVGGGTPSTGNQSYWDGDIDWYAPAEIADQIYANSSQKKITGLGYENSSAKMLPPGTVLFTSRAGIGKTAILTRKGCTNQGFQSIVPHRGELDSYFIFSRTEELKRYGELVGAGSTFVEVSGKQMAVMELMMPPTMREQQTIGGFFQQLDHLITLHQRECKYIKLEANVLSRIKETDLFCDYYDQWIKVYKEGAVRKVTMDKYRMTYSWLKRLAPSLRLCDVTRVTYQQILNNYAVCHERQTTMDFHHQLKGAIIDAVDDGLIAKDPTRKAIIKGKTPAAKKIIYLYQYELHTLLSELDLRGDINWDWLILLTAKTGMRFSEVLALTPNDFDFAHQMLLINKTWDYKGNGGFLPTKNRSSVRKIQIDWQTVIQFSELVKKLPPDKPIFVQKERVYNSTVNDILARHCQKANIPIISVHGLRHTHASLLLFAGVSIASVARRLGHSSMTTTQKTYLHIIQELENQDVDLVMRSLSGLS